jgi:hypothetical protein
VTHSTAGSIKRIPRGILTGVVLTLGTLTIILSLMALSARVVQVRTTSLTPTFPVGDWIIRDLGSNLPTAAILGSLTLLVGLAAWVLGGYQWAAGLITGSALSLVGWSALVLGLVERPISVVQKAVSAAAPIGTEPFAATIQRDAGTTLLVLAAIFALATAVVAGSQLQADPQGGLNPWVAALGAMAALGVAIGPLLPVGSAVFSDNLASSSSEPALFLLGRLVQLGVTALAGVIGFLLVRTAGLGLVAGSFTMLLWLTGSVAFTSGPNPVGPGFSNPGRFATGPEVINELHSVTSVSVVLLAVMIFGAAGAALAKQGRHEG